MRKVVEETFIDEPSNITRSSCVSTNKFLIVMMSFIFTVVTLISDNPAILNKIKLYYSEIKTPQEHYLEYNMNSTNYNENGRPPSKQYQQPPYELLHPSMLKYLDQQIASMKTNGGRRNRKTAKSKKSNNKPYYPYRTH